MGQKNGQWQPADQNQDERTINAFSYDGGNRWPPNAPGSSDREPTATSPRGQGQWTPQGQTNREPKRTPPRDHSWNRSIASSKVRREAEEAERRRRIFMIAGISAGALVIVVSLILIVILLRPAKSDAGKGASGQDGPKLPDSGDAGEDPSGWSQWMKSLPKDVGEDDYIIEERTLYSTRSLETTSSTRDKKMQGWELYETVEGDGGWGVWSDWSETPVTGSQDRDVQQQIRYRYRDKETTTGKTQTMAGWTLEKTTYEYGDYGSWSSWSSTQPAASENRQVESKTQYRYRDKETTDSFFGDEIDGWILDWEEDYSEPWTDWTDTQPFALGMGKETETREVEDKTSYLMGHYCTGNVPGAEWKTAPSNQTGDPTFNANCIYESLGWYDDLSSFTQGNGGYIGPTCGNSCWTWYIMDTSTTYKTQYRWRTHYTIHHMYRWGAWSGWSDNKVSASSTREVQTNTQYHYRERTQKPVYHFSRWKAWSNWGTTEYQPSSSREVEAKTFYSYRDRVTETTYYYRRWTDWSDYSETPAEKSDTLDVQTVIQYRYRRK